MDEIKKFLRAGSVTHSVQFSSYFTERWNLSSIQGYNYAHKTVNNSIYFVDPETGYHTNKFDRFFGNMKTDTGKNLDVICT